MTFMSDDARRVCILERVREQFPELRKQHYFPVGEDEDILRLSDPVWYTVCRKPVSGRLRRIDA